MVKITVAVVALALAGTASADGWRKLRVDGSSEAGLTKSMATFEEELPPGRYQVLLQALEDIWREGTRNARAGEREYTAADFLRDLDGLRYKEVVEFTDPTGLTARARYRQAFAQQNPGATNLPAAPGMPASRPAPIGWNGQQVRGATQGDMLPRGCNAGCSP
jgi:hypothetical protein